MTWLIPFILNAVALLIADQLIEGIHLSGIGAAVLAAVAMALVNTFIKPLLILMTLPLSVITLGFFILVVNALTFFLAALLVPGFQVDTFSGAFWGAILTSIVSWILNILIGER